MFENMSTYTAVIDKFIANIIQFPIEDVEMSYDKEFTHNIPPPQKKMSSYTAI